MPRQSYRGYAHWRLDPADIRVRRCGWRTNTTANHARRPHRGDDGGIRPHASTGCFERMNVGLVLEANDDVHIGRLVCDRRGVSRRRLRMYGPSHGRHFYHQGVAIPCAPSQDGTHGSPRTFEKVSFEPQGPVDFIRVQQICQLAHGAPLRNAEQLPGRRVHGHHDPSEVQHGRGQRMPLQQGSLPLDRSGVIPVGVANGTRSPPLP